MSNTVYRYESDLLTKAHSDPHAVTIYVPQNFKNPTDWTYANKYEIRKDSAHKGRTFLVKKWIHRESPDLCTVLSLDKIKDNIFVFTPHRKSAASVTKKYRPGLPVSANFDEAVEFHKDFFKKVTVFNTIYSP